MSDWWVREHWGRAFDVEIVGPGVETLNQSWAVLRKKQVELTAAELMAGSEMKKAGKPASRRRWWHRNG
jgi:hypothetical protein